MARTSVEKQFEVGETSLVHVTSPDKSPATARWFRVVSTFWLRGRGTPLFGTQVVPPSLPVDVLRDIPDTICIFGHCFILKFQVYASDLPSWSCRNWWILSLDLALFNQGDPLFWHCQSATDLREGFLRNLHTICGINSVGPSLCHWDLIALRLGTVVTVRFGGRSSPGTIRNEFGGPLTYDLTTCLQPAVETVRDERRFCRISPGHSGPCVTN